MLNSFNLFLSLLSFWALFMVASNHVSLLYIICGIFSAIFVTAISSRLKLIEKNSEMLYLSLGFYRHFLKLFFTNFLPSLKLLMKMAFREDLLAPTSHIIKIDKKNLNLSALISTINMTSGLVVINLKDPEITIHAVESTAFEVFDLKKTQKVLQHINDDNLV